jgi:hypothetical protein
MPRTPPRSEVTDDKAIAGLAVAKNADCRHRAFGTAASTTCTPDYCWRIASLSTTVLASVARPGTALSTVLAASRAGTGRDEGKSKEDDDDDDSSGDDASTL